MRPPRGSLGIPAAGSRCTHGRESLQVRIAPRHQAIAAFREGRAHFFSFILSPLRENSSF